MKTVVIYPQHDTWEFDRIMDHNAFMVSVTDEEFRILEAGNTDTAVVSSIVEESWVKSLPRVEATFPMTIEGIFKVWWEWSPEEEDND